MKILIGICLMEIRIALAPRMLGIACVSDIKKREINDAIMDVKVNVTGHYMAEAISDAANSQAKPSV